MPFPARSFPFYLSLHPKRNPCLSPGKPLSQQTKNKYLILPIPQSAQHFLYSAILGKDPGAGRICATKQYPSLRHVNRALTKSLPSPIPLLYWHLSSLSSVPVQIFALPRGLHSVYQRTGEYVQLAEVGALGTGVLGQSSLVKLASSLWHTLKDWNRCSLVGYSLPLYITLCDEKFVNP